MAESFVFNIAEDVLGKLGSHVIEEVRLARGAKKELNKLKDTLSTIKAVLLDAEEQQANNNQLRDWLGKLKEICYDADDVVDEFEIEGLRQLVNRGSIKRKVRSFFSQSNPPVLAFRLGHKIKDIRVRLDEIAANKANFHLEERYVGRHIVHRRREKTHSFERESNVFGRDDDKEKIIQLLMRFSHHKSLSVIPIIGIGGLGKTTLARMVYNDKRVEGHFGAKMWVCVSENFDLKTLCANIIKRVTGENYERLDLESLQTPLRNCLRNKKFLLILDDVWNEEHQKWNDLKNLLEEGDKGSQIVVTTRSQKVAQIMGTMLAYNLKGLSDEDCLPLLVKRAFREGEEREYPNLVKIGEEIVKKCKGVPLAAKTLGGLLFLKTDERDWLSIRDSEIWKLEQKEGDILPALKLSYDQLPYYLKRCFAYCSIFPKDYEFSNRELIELWVAEGLIQSPSDGNAELEDIGEGYIRDLLSISFIEFTEEEFFIPAFKMHDLVHDLALSVAKTEFCVVQSREQKISRTIRRVSFSAMAEESQLWGEVPRCLLELNYLRTISFRREGDFGPISKAWVDTCISRFKYLRVLDLQGCELEALPGWIGNLKHLRYLSLAGNDIIKTLPTSICKLQCLQTLNLVACDKLEELPRDIWRLISLRSLWITTKQRCLPDEENGMGRLTSLRYLFIAICPNIECLPKGLQRLTALRSLAIARCAKLVSLSRGIQSLSALQNLVIADCEKLDLKMEEREDADVQGLRSLRSLWIKKLPMLVALPRWLLLQGSSATAATPITLQHLCVSACYNLTTLTEELGNLSSLRKLEIYRCPKLTSLPEGMRRLTALRELEIRDCPELIKRCQGERGEDWPKIAHVPRIDLGGHTPSEEMCKPYNGLVRSDSFEVGSSGVIW